MIFLITATTVPAGAWQIFFKPAVEGEFFTCRKVETTRRQIFLTVLGDFQTSVKPVVKPAGP
jgi:hypothetical protein